MPRRNRRPARRRRAVEPVAVEATPMSGEEMARLLVDRGLASPLVLEHAPRRPDGRRFHFTENGARA